MSWKLRAIKREEGIYAQLEFNDKVPHSQYRIEPRGHNRLRSQLAKVIRKREVVVNLSAWYC